jgi:hypothetical protein
VCPPLGLLHPLYQEQYGYAYMINVSPWTSIRGCSLSLGCLKVDFSVRHQVASSVKYQVECIVQGTKVALVGGQFVHTLSNRYHVIVRKQTSTQQCCSF